MSQTTTDTTGGNGGQNNQYSELVEAVAEDEGLMSGDKETIIKFAKSDQSIRVYSEEAGLMRRLLQHPNFDCETLRITTKDSWGKRVDPDDFEGGVITGVDGWLPIGVLTIGTSTRSTSSHAEIVSERVLDGE
jgi:hypothetical protein